MKKIPYLGILAAVIYGLPILSLTGAVDMFLELDGIEGESQDKVYKDDIDVLAWSWGASNSGNAITGPGKANFQDISITKWVDKSSPELMLRTASGDSISKGTLTVRKAGSPSFEFLILTMEQILVTSVSVGAQIGEDRLTESVSLNFAKFKLKYVPQNADGSAGTAVEIGWDISKNSKL